jgi:hypothetical protein
MTTFASRKNSARGDLMETTSDARNDTTGVAGEVTRQGTLEDSRSYAAEKTPKKPQGSVQVVRQGTLEDSRQLTPETKGKSAASPARVVRQGTLEDSRSLGSKKKLSR